MATDGRTTESRIGYTFRDGRLLQRALTLSSADAAFNNQSLECLGDAVLTLIVAEKYYLEGESEGEITERKKNLVSDRALGAVSAGLGLDGDLIRGRGDDRNKKAVPSVYEAVAGAIYLDGGLDAARDFALRTLNFAAADCGSNYVGALKEYFEGLGKIPPVAEVSGAQSGGVPSFTAVYTVDGRRFSGTADNKSRARQLAAQQAVNYLRENSENGTL